MRIIVAHADHYLEAAEIAEELRAGFPDKIFQIRRRHNKFIVVERVFNPEHNPEKLSPSKKRKKNRGLAF